METKNIKDLKRYYRDHRHGFFFERGTMRFFNSRVMSTVFVGREAWYFVTSERFEQQKRKYTIRAMMLNDADINTYPNHSEGFQKYNSAKSAERAIIRLIEEGTI